jgi:hypothetical protein
MTDRIKGYIFFGLAVALAVLYYLYDRRGRQMDALLLEAQKQLLGQQLRSIQEQASKEGVEREKALERYESLKRLHGPLLERLGLRVSRGSEHPGEGK